MKMWRMCSVTLGAVVVCGLCLANDVSRVSVNSAGIEGSGASFTPALSEDGRFVAF